MKVKMVLVVLVAVLVGGVGGYFGRGLNLSFNAQELQKVPYRSPVSTNTPVRGLNFQDWLNYYFQYWHDVVGPKDCSPGYMWDGQKCVDTSGWGNWNNGLPDEGSKWQAWSNCVLGVFYSGFGVTNEDIYNCTRKVAAL